MVKGKENKPVVLQVLPELEMGGVEIGTVEIAGGMQKHGITNFVASQGGRLVYDLEKIRVGHLTLPLKTKNIFKMRKTPTSWRSLSGKTASTSCTPVRAHRPGAPIGRQRKPASIT